MDGRELGKKLSSGTPWALNVYFSCQRDILKAVED